MCGQLPHIFKQYLSVVNNSDKSKLTQVPRNVYERVVRNANNFVSIRYKYSSSNDNIVQDKPIHIALKRNYYLLE